MRYLFILLETTLTCDGVVRTCVILLHSEHKMEIDTSISVLLGPPPARLQLLLISRPFSRFFLLHRRVVCVRRRHLTFSAARQWRWRRLMIHHQQHSSSLRDEKRKNNNKESPFHYFTLPFGPGVVKSFLFLPRRQVKEEDLSSLFLSASAAASSRKKRKEKLLHI